MFGISVRHPLVVYPEHFAVLRAGRDLDRHFRALYGRDLDLGAKRGLHDRDAAVIHQVHAVARKMRVVFKAHFHIKVAGAAAFEARVTRAGNAQRSTFVGAGRDLNIEGGGLLLLAGAAAFLTRRGHHFSLAAAVRTGLAERKETLGVLHAARAAASGAFF